MISELQLNKTAVKVKALKLSLLKDHCLFVGLKSFTESFQQSSNNWIVIYGVTEKAMAPHSSTLAWKIPWMEEPGRLQSMGSLRVGHD